MMRAPWFWREKTLAARAVALGLAPLAVLYDIGQRARWRITTPKRAPVPVICIGNATLGGVGKTPFAMALKGLLGGDAVHFLTRGYGGSLHGPLRVHSSTHDVSEVGDEALVLARCGTVWVSKDRPAGASAAAKAGAELIIMDDGFQNPTLEKTVSILLIDAAGADGNGKIFPAGPYREPLERARARADIVVYVGGDAATATAAAQKHTAPFAAWLEPDNPPQAGRVVAFSGIAKPQKFFKTLAAAGFEIAKPVSFPDHHRFSNQDLFALARIAAAKGAPLITTEKDYARLPDDFRAGVLVFPVTMKINQPALLVETIQAVIAREAP